METIILTLHVKKKKKPKIMKAKKNKEKINVFYAKFFHVFLNEKGIKNFVQKQPL